MWIKSTILICYLLAAYWLSSHFGILKMCFYPTLGAFGYFFISRSLNRSEALKVIAAAVTASATGSVLHALSPGAVAFVLTCIVTICLIQLIRIHAAPILAVAFIPFFAPLPAIWTLPVFVCGSLLGLLVALGLSQALEAGWASLYTRTKTKAANLEAGS
ncbi:hypothetical protein [Paenibacillus ginsengarvi]|uniref:HPP family protein n=1 Tax=Paenibacillus ginsengarvi TaxID=400777 RepID=A0A3B0CJR3_9BACL|nr:hypothetical protein [Paenibacillus ginsengarvi]RKN85895.1 hypothetical protein D7M11_06060 [Paenibacillus ginsengarvi]